MTETACSRVDRVRDVAPRMPSGSEECWQTGGWWVHVRLCLTRAHVGGCDDTPDQGATARYHPAQHPRIRSFEPGEAWPSCYPNDVFFEQVPASTAA